MGGPAFPPEIFDHILHYVGERGFDEPFNRYQINTLYACALVCSHFASTCRQILFRRIDDIHVYGPKAANLDRLRRVLQHPPESFNLVQELGIVLDIHHGTAAEIDQIVPPFPCLQNLTIFASCDDVSSSLHNSSITSYFSQHTLISLRVDGPDAMYDTLWPLILPSIYLQRLSLRGQQLVAPVSATINSSITTLELDDIFLFSVDLCTLSLFSNLQFLEVRHVWVDIPGHSRHLGGRVARWVPPPHLRKIVVTCGHRRGAMIVLDGMVHGIRKSPMNNPHLQELHTLSSEVHDRADVDVVCSLVAYAPALQRLDLIVDAKVDNLNDGLVMKIETILPNIAQYLTYLSLGQIAIVPVFHLQLDVITIYHALLSDIQSLIDQMGSSPNILQTIHIDISINITQPTGPLMFDFWGNMATVLANVDRFPSLREVRVCVILNPADKDIRTAILCEFDGEDELKLRLARAMRKLGKRRGVLLSAKMILEGQSNLLG